MTSPHFVFLVDRTPSPTSIAAHEQSQHVAGPARLGVVVSRKVGTAVGRNRVKRLCRECFRRQPQWLPPGIDLVVIARPGAKDLGLDGLQQEWASVAGAVARKAASLLAKEPGHEHASGTRKSRP